jgi:hypothetical protein
MGGGSRGIAPRPGRFTPRKEKSASPVGDSKSESSSPSPSMAMLKIIKLVDQYIHNYKFKKFFEQDFY